VEVLPVQKKYRCLELPAFKNLSFFLLQIYAAKAFVKSFAKYKNFKQKMTFKIIGFQKGSGDTLL
jgi:hypothetical protein